MTEILGMYLDTEVEIRGINFLMSDQDVIGGEAL